MSQPQPDLATSQHRFAQAMRDATQIEPTLNLLTGDASITQRRLAIYRGNVVAAASKSLSLAYPVIQQITGEAFFSGLARAYWQQTPSSSGNLHDYGANFDGFLATFPHTQDYPYLPDLARLEWVVHQAGSTLDAQAFNPSEIADFSEHQLPGLRFHFTPGFALVPSVHPIVQIWTIHQSTYRGAFEVDWDQAQNALIHRDGLRVKVIAIDAGQQAALASLIAGQTLSDALDAACVAQTDFDIESALALWISSGWISDVYCDDL